MQFNDYENFFRCFNINPESGCDIPGGFQDINPELFITIAELLGNIMAGNMPFNVQNAVGNWLMLVGQAIVTFNAQQQYFQNGPGRYYNIKYRNSGNPFTTDGYTQDESASSKTNNTTNERGSTSNAARTRNTEDLESKMDKFIKEIEDLRREVEYLKSKE